MKPLIVASVILLASIAGNALGACASTSSRVTGNLTNFLQGNTVCVPNGSGGWRWQEQHRAGGQLWDFKRGSSTVDPTDQVGTWSATNGANAQVTHAYTGGGSFSWAVWDNLNGTHSFCGSTEIVATIKSGISGCP